MSICAPEPFGSKFLKGGYSYWPLWWYGQKSKLPDMSGHGVTLYPSGAYFDGQGYYFDGSDDYMLDSYGRKIIGDPTKGSWSSVYLTDGEVPAEGNVMGAGTEIWLNTSEASPKITGKIVLHHKYCPNLKRFGVVANQLSSVNISDIKTLEGFWCYRGTVSTINVSKLPSLVIISLHTNYIANIDISGSPLIDYFNSRSNSMDQDAVDKVLCDINSFGTSSSGMIYAYIAVYDNTAPSAAGIACKNELVSRGWTVTTD